MRSWHWLCLLALSPMAWASTPPPVGIDTQRSVIGFEIRTRYGQRLSGRFPVFNGQLLTLPDGQHQVVLDIDARHAQMEGPSRYTRWLLGEDFFDVARHPQIVFRSRPHPAGLPQHGGAVGGELTLRGHTGPIQMHVDSAECGAPGYDCPVSGRGTVSRTAYGMDGWQLVVGDRVTFLLQIRLDGPGPS
jgi:polyisoprenoid-binding protein YceI